ncbi:Rieske 2Fe-2S domain-containing protein [Leptobacterium flavescens]|uniref:Rieske 2Fe-2S domain-containing protein n=1 Tax=Leptobacterium flavescens TaxID=472055 RepID=A0A6P0UN56_9FLAO|nr:Rieske 2Fe-2S domain-containing protein [Leptobacterium flavescens]NER14605.1 Rieske 2Fe-2S domain-containing protein [Leptobacterium flavescens]
MGLNYQTVLWNKHKKVYDKLIVAFMLIYIILFAGLTFAFNGETTIETLIIRAFGTLAVIMLHIILAIGPLSRLNTRFLPLLYNRRHLGVSMFLAAAVHGVFSIIQFHTLGNVNPIYSVFTSNLDYNSLANFPFQVLGFLALIILFFMAATSHDFWLKNLSPKTWKRLHMMVYLAYALIILHVFLGAFQQETSPFTIGFLSIGFVVIAVLHLAAGFKERRTDIAKAEKDEVNWLYVCTVDEIEENRAKIFTVGKERVAVFKYEGKLSAIHNVCKHQGGPLGEGKIVDGCITCPWHGYQYLPGNGQSPPPFTEKVATYELKLAADKIYLNPEAFPEGTEVQPVNC